MALKVVQRKKENSLLVRKLDMEQMKTLDKPDDPIKEVATMAERDNASDLLAASRCCLTAAYPYSGLGENQGLRQGLP